MRTKISTVILLAFLAIQVQAQTGKIINHQATHFAIETKSDTIDFIVVDTILNKTKPLFLWCQGSLPMPLFCEIENYGYYFLGGGVINFNYKAIAQNYNLVIISMPKTPVMAKKENLNSSYQYVPNPQNPNEYFLNYVKADYLQNYVNRANQVLAFLKKQKWVNPKKLVVAGHSQGSHVAAKIAATNKDVTHLGLFSANPFGRIDQQIREARLDAQLGKMTWQEADTLMKQHVEFYKQLQDPKVLKEDAGLLAWKTFSEPKLDDWLSLNIPIYLAYGTEDRVSDLCDIVPLFFIEKGKQNLTLKRHIGLEHNFFEVSENGATNYEKAHWKNVMDEFVQWVK